MVPAPPPLPTRFPCWCRAVYSWGGEGPRDLGFIEGDLIECLNAGDGSWWTGRLWRDRRTVGSFPSNFVEVLRPDFRPTTRSASPLPGSGGPSPTVSSPEKPTTTMFRKPFQAYTKAPHYTTAKQPEVYREDPRQRQRADSTASHAARSIHTRDVSPVPPFANTHRDASPAGSYRRAASPAPSTYHARMDSDSYRRAASPAPSFHHNAVTSDPYRRAASPAPSFRAVSPAPNHHHHHHHHQQHQNPHNPHHHPYPTSHRDASPAPPSHRAISPAPYRRDTEPAVSSSYNRAISPAPFRRDASPQPGFQRSASPRLDSYRSASPAPFPRTASPAAYHRDESPGPSYRRAISPVPALHNKQLPPTHHHQHSASVGETSPPPPPPPPHRHVQRQDTSKSFQHDSREMSMVPQKKFLPYRSQPDLSRFGSQSSSTTKNPKNLKMDLTNPPRSISPLPPSSTRSRLTPSPLREAMDGVIEQLDALGMSRDADAAPPSRTPSDPWSPESFGLVSYGSKKKPPVRSQTLPPASAAQYDEGYETASHPSNNNSQSEITSNLPKLSNYVERMESRLRKMHDHNATLIKMGDEAPPPPPKSTLDNRPKSSMGPDTRAAAAADADTDLPLGATNSQKLRHRKSAYEVGRSVLQRTFTTKTNSTNATNSTSTTQSSSRSLMSGASAGAFSATSAGSYARRTERARSALGMRDPDDNRPETPFTGVTYHSSHASGSPTRPQSQAAVFHDEPGLGGLVQPRAPKRNIFKKILDTAKTGVASGRSSIATGADPRSSSQMGGRSAPNGGLNGMTNIGRDATARDMGLASAIDWVQVRRDVNRSNSLSRIERGERRDRCQMLDYPTLNPVEEFYNSIEGDEGANGNPVRQPINYQAISMPQVDKNSRFLSSLPPLTNAITLASTYVCRPYRSDAQRLRAIFTWVAEKVCWEEDFEGEVDTRRVIQSRRACAEEYSVLVYEMCSAVGIQCEVVRGYLKTPGEVPESNLLPRSNHWWNAVLVDNEWRMMDCCLASASYPHRGLYSSVGGSTADFWWFLARPSEMCWTHIPEHHSQQHICPPVAHDILVNLPCACAPYFRNNMEMVDYSTSSVRIEDLEMVHIKFSVPEDIEVAAEVEVRAFGKDADGDFFENGDTIKKRALAQAEWYGGIKRYTVKAILPGDEGQGVLKIYAGKRGLMHSIKDIPHPLAFALPIIHTGENPGYEFVIRHPTPHAQRHDIYVVQPQCHQLALNNTFVFAVRQNPSSLSFSSGESVASTPSSGLTPTSNPFDSTLQVRPGSAMSMTASSSISGSNPSTTSSGTHTRKPAKLAIQTPGGKILRLMRKDDRKGGLGGGRGIGADEEVSDGGTWETIIKCSERGTWRGLVLADRTARWCVFAEWTCVG